VSLCPRRPPVRVRDVVRGRKLPMSALGKEEREVLRVIISVHKVRVAQVVLGWFRPCRYLPSSCRKTQSGFGEPTDVARAI
jgi:hypothetical protein